MYKYWRFEDECFILHKQLIILFMSNTIIRDANLSDILSIKNLYLDVAEKYPDNLLPTISEITNDFVYNGLVAGITRGFAIVIEKDGEIIGYAQGYQPDNVRESHLIKDTRVVMHSKYTSTGYGIKLILAARNKVHIMSHIKSALFNVRGHNTASARGLKYIGCYEVSCDKNALLMNDGSFMEDIVYKWDNPNFSMQSCRDRLFKKIEYSGEDYNVYDDLSLSARRTWATNTSSISRYSS